MFRKSGNKLNFALLHFCLLLLWQLIVATHCSAQSNEQAAQNLKIVREKIEREERRLDDLRKSQTQIKRSVDALGQEVNRSNERKQAVRSEINDLTEEGLRIEQDLQRTKEQLVGRKEGLRQRIVAIYKTQRRTVALDYLFGARSATDLLKRAHYLNAVAQYDRSYMLGLNKLLLSLQRDQSRLQNVKQKKTARLSELEHVEKELTTKLSQQAILLDDERDKVKQQERSLEKLRADAEKLDRVLAGIMGGEQYQPEPQETGEKPELAMGEQKPEQVIATPSGGMGLASFKGKLSFPVAGELIQTFGKQKHEEFADVLFVKGLEVKAGVGTKVRAIASGKVVLSQVLPGYGNVLILDHGERYYSLYGRLSSSLRKVGEVAKVGDVLAVLGEPDYRGRNFYFELRIKGKATDPRSYFKVLPPLMRDQA